MNRNKYFIAGAALVAGVLVVYFAISGFPPGGEVAGTMAASDTTIAGVEQAERYRADAISDADVQLDDQAINDLLQDPDVVALLQDEEFRNALQDGSMASAMLEPSFAEVMQRGILQAAFSEFPDFRSEFLRGNLRSYFARQDNRMAKFEHYEMLRTTFARNRVIEALNSRSLRSFLTQKSSPKLDYALERSLARADFRTALRTEHLRTAAADANYLSTIGVRR